MQMRSLFRYRTISKRLPMPYIFHLSNSKLSLEFCSKFRIPASTFKCCQALSRVLWNMTILVSWLVFWWMTPVQTREKQQASGLVWPRICIDCLCTSHPPQVSWLYICAGCLHASPLAWCSCHRPPTSSHPPLLLLPMSNNILLELKGLSPLFRTLSLQWTLTVVWTSKLLCCMHAMLNTTLRLVPHLPLCKHVCYCLP